MPTRCPVLWGIPWQGGQKAQRKLVLEFTGIPWELCQGANGWGSIRQCNCDSRGSDYCARPLQSHNESVFSACQQYLVRFARISLPGHHKCRRRLRLSWKRRGQILSMPTKNSDLDHQRRWSVTQDREPTRRHWPLPQNLNRLRHFSVWEPDCSKGRPRQNIEDEWPLHFRDHWGTEKRGKFWCENWWILNENSRGLRAHHDARWAQVWRL